MEELDESYLDTLSTICCSLLEPTVSLNTEEGEDGRIQLQLMFKKKTPAQQVKQSQKDVQSNIRDLERDLLRIKRDEEALIKDLKASAANGNDASTRILAQNLIRLRAQKDRLNVSMAGLRGINTNLAAAASTVTIANASANAGKAMEKVQLQPQQVQQNAMQFAQQNSRLEITQDMMTDAIDSLYDNGELEEDTEELMGQVLDEIGIDLKTQLASVPTTRPAEPAGAATVDEDDLSTRLAALR